MHLGRSDRYRCNIRQPSNECLDVSLRVYHSARAHDEELDVSFLAGGDYVLFSNAAEFDRLNDGLARTGFVHLTESTATASE